MPFDPTLDIPPPPLLHDQLHDAALALAGAINAGDFAALTHDARLELRALSIALAGWSDAARKLRAASFRPGLRLIAQPATCPSCGTEVLTG